MLNLDGLLIQPPENRDRGLYGYIQVFRTGAIEAVQYGGALLSEGRDFIPSTSATSFYRDAILSFIALAKRFSIAGPVIVGCSLLHVGTYELAVGNYYNSFNRAFADRAHLILPEAWLSDAGEASNADSSIKPLMDILWQAFNVERCLEYTESGEWAPPKGNR